MTTTEYARGSALNNGRFEKVDCYLCGVAFHVPEMLDKVRLADHRSFWCPLGHEQHYVQGKTEAQIERERRERAERDAANAREDARVLNAKLVATKGQLTRARNRAKAGVCPCCDRTFVQLSRHIATKHPEFAK